MFSALIISLLSATALAAPQWAPGEDIDNGMAVQITAQGLDNLGAMVPGLIADVGATPVGDQNVSTLCTGVDTTNMWVELQVLDTRVLPSSSPAPDVGKLNIEIDLAVRINSSTDKFGMDIEVLCVTTSCPGFVDWFPVSITLPIELAITPDPTTGDPVMKATMGDLAQGVNHGLQGDQINLDCGLDTAESILNVFGLSIYDFIIGLVEPILIGQIAGQQGDIEQQINDALAAASFEDDIDVLGSNLHVRIMPSHIATAPAGLELQMLTGFDMDQAECIADYDPDGSLRTDSTVPSILDNPASADLTAHLSDDMLNSAMYAIWRGGALCMDLGPDQLQGLPADTSLLTLIGGEAYEAIVPQDPQPLIIRTDPKTPMVVQTDGAHDMVVQIRDLDIEFFGPIDYRMARALGTSISVDAGVDLEFDGTTGELAVVLDLKDTLQVTLSPDIMVPGYEDEIAANFEGVLSGLMDTLLDSLIGSSLTFIMPDVDGMGLTSLDVAPSGANNDWLATHAQLGTDVPYAGASGCGCDGSGGCSSSGSGCGGSGGGCSVGGVYGAPWAIALGLAMVRRRRRRGASV